MRDSPALVVSGEMPFWMMSCRSWAIGVERGQIGAQRAIQPLGLHSDLIDRGRFRLESRDHQDRTREVCIPATRLEPFRHET